MRWLAVVAAVVLHGAATAQFGSDCTVHGVPAAGLPFGAPFEIELRRHWPEGWQAQAFDDAVLAPLVVQLLDATLAPRAGGGWQETRRYRARAVGIGDVLVPPFAAAVVGPGGERQQLEFTVPALRVLSVLSEPAGPVEWPGDVRELPRRRLLPWLTGLVVLGLGFGAWRRWRRATAPPPAAVGAPAPALHAVALARLRALPEAGDDDPALVARFYAALAEILRDYTGQRFGLPAPVRTSQELVAAVPVGGEALGACLWACDLVKFGAAVPAAPAHAAARAAAVDFVQVAGDAAGEEERE